MNTALRQQAAARRHANALRFLAIDAVEAAKSGHPGMPMGMADIAEVLWRGHLNHDPNDPHWADRDRFVLSNGHGSMLLYALLHLSGYDLPLEELKRFRQMGSKTPGHPEVGMTPGVETTTGPLGQGLANAVGMAFAERLLAREFNRPGHAIVDHRTYVFLGDGCLMEGVSHEACSLAGVLGLGKLVAFYDDNGISIDGHVQGWFRDDTRKRFEAYGWHVVGPIDGHDRTQIDAAIRTAHACDDRPTLVICRTTIGWGSPKMAGTHDVHGAPLGADEARATRAALGWDAPPFEIPQDVREAWDARADGAARSTDWRRRFDAYAQAYPREAAEFSRRMRGELPAHWTQIARQAVEAALAISARKSVSSGSPIARSTCDGSSVPDEHAEPVDTAMPSRSSAMRRLSASTRSKLMLVVFGMRASARPLTAVPDIPIRIPASRRSRSAETRASRMPCSRSRSTMRSRVRCEVMPMPRAPDEASCPATGVLRRSAARG